MKFIPMYDSWLLLAALAKRLRTEELVNVLGKFKDYAPWHGLWHGLQIFVKPRAAETIEKLGAALHLSASMDNLNYARSAVEVERLIVSCSFQVHKLTSSYKLLQALVYRLEMRLKDGGRLLRRRRG